MTYTRWRSVALRNALAPRVCAAAPAPRHALDAVDAAHQRHDLQPVVFLQQVVLQGLVLRPALELGGPVAAAEVGRLDRRLDVEPAVEGRGRGLRHVVCALPDR